MPRVHSEVFFTGESMNEIQYKKYREVLQLWFEDKRHNLYLQAIEEDWSWETLSDKLNDLFGRFDKKRGAAYREYLKSCEVGKLPRAKNKELVVMPRVHHVKKARKDNPVVKKGESYYWWKFAYSPKRFSKTRPRASQLTQSDKLSRYYEAQETIEDLDAQGDIQSIIEALQEVVEEIHQIGEEYQESADNIRGYFEESSTADECEEKANSCESTASSIEEAISELEHLELGDDDFETVPNIVTNISWEL